VGNGLKKERKEKGKGGKSEEGISKEKGSAKERYKRETWGDKGEGRGWRGGW